MLAATKYVSFMLRFSNESEPFTHDDRWHTEIEHVHTGEHWWFDEVDAALEFLRRYVEDDDHVVIDVVHGATAAFGNGGSAVRE